LIQSSPLPAPTLTLAVEHFDTFIVVHCSGRLVSGVNQQLNEKVGELLPGPKRIVLDFQHLTHMDSSGLGSLVRLYVHAKSAGCALEVANMGKSIRSLLGITHLLSVLESVGEHHIRMG
jgi:anti-sigma B factor antagonist